jgi:hypothetical protein
MLISVSNFFGREERGIVGVGEDVGVDDGEKGQEAEKTAQAARVACGYRRG